MISMRRTVRPILVTVATGTLILAIWQKVEAQQTPDPQQAMVSVLSALNPHPSLGDAARVWDRFVGTWDCDYTFFLDDGTVKHSRGELEFGWILDGRAI